MLVIEAPPFPHKNTKISEKFDLLLNYLFSASLQLIY